MVTNTLDGENGLMEQQEQQHRALNETQNEQMQEEQRTQQMPTQIQQAAPQQEQQAVERMRILRRMEVHQAPRIQRTAPVTPDPYAGMTARERRKAIQQEKKVRKQYQKQAKKAQKQAARVFDKPLEAVSPELLGLLSQSQEFFSEQEQQPFDVMEASRMQLDISCLEDQDFANTGKTIDIKKALQQNDTLKKLWNMRIQHRDQWNRLDRETQARCSVLLDQYHLYRNYMNASFTRYNLNYVEYEDEDKVAVNYLSKSPKQREEAVVKQQKFRDILEARKLTEEADLAYYREREVPQITEAERDAYIQQEQEDYRTIFGDDQPLLHQMTKDQRKNFMQGLQKLRPEFKESVTRTSNLFMALTKQPDENWWPNLKLKSLGQRDIMIARGAQNAEAFSDNDFLITELDQTVQMLDDIDALCKMDKGGEVPGVTYEQAVERAYQHFETCFDRFKNSFEQVRTKYKTAFTPEGIAVQLHEYARFYGYWQSLAEIYKQSPALTARIPEEQLLYIRSIASMAQSFPTNQMTEGFDQNNVYRDQGNLSINDPVVQDMARANICSEISTELWNCHSDSLTFRRAVEYSDANGIRPEVAYHVLRHMGYREEDETFAERFRMGQDDTDLSGMDLLQVMDYRNNVYQQNNQQNQSRVAGLIRSRLQEQKDTQGADIYENQDFYSLHHRIQGLSLSRMTGNVHVLMPGKSDAEIVEFYMKQISLQKYVAMKQRVDSGEATEAERAEVTAKQAEMERLDNEMLDEWKHILENTYQAIQQKFGRLITQLHIVDFFQLCGPEMERYIRTIQDLFQIQKLLNNEGRLTKEETEKFNAMADQAVAWSAIWSMHAQISANQRRENPISTADLLEGCLGSLTKTDANTEGGPSMNEEEMQTYIRTVRERYPDMLYGRFR